MSGFSFNAVTVKAVLTLLILAAPMYDPVSGKLAARNLRAAGERSQKIFCFTCEPSRRRHICDNWTN